MVDIGIIEKYKSEDKKPKSNGIGQNGISSADPLQIAEKMIAEAIDGEKHIVLCKASYLLGGYVGSGEIPKDQAGDTLRKAIENKQNVADINAAYITIDKCLEAGMRHPLYKSNGNIKENLASIDDINFIEIAPLEKIKKIDNKFPIEVFPYFIQTFIAEANESLYYPEDYLASAILTAVSIALGRKITVEVKRGWIEQAVLYMALVGNPGDNKSHPLEYALKPILDSESKLFDEYRREYEEYKSMTEEEKKGQRPPIQKQYTVNDFTNEALLSVHLNNLNGIGVYKDELMGWIKEMNRYRSGGDEQFWISNFSGKPITVNRKSGDNFHIDSPFISVIGTVQPGIIREIFSSDFLTSGFTDRILFAYPNQKLVRKWTEDEVDHKIVDSYTSTIKNILKMKVSDAPGIESKTITFNNEAKEIFKNHFNNTEKLKQHKTINNKVKEYSSKLISYVARLSLILQVLSWATEGKRSLDYIDSDSMKGAIRLVDYYKNCYSRILSEVNSKQKDTYTKEEVAKILNDNGIPFRRIAEYFKVGKSTIGDWIKKYKPDNGQRT